MANGKNFYLTQKEVSALLSVCGEWCEIMEQGEETEAFVEDTLNEGLGSALRKLYAGRNGERAYSKYKTVR